MLFRKKKKDFFWDALSFVDDASHLASSLTTQCKKKITLKRDSKLDANKFHPEHGIIDSQLTELAHNWLSAHSLLLKHAQNYCSIT